MCLDMIYVDSMDDEMDFSVAFWSFKDQKGVIDGEVEMGHIMKCSFVAFEWLLLHLCYHMAPPWVDQSR